MSDYKKKIIVFITVLLLTLSQTGFAMAATGHGADAHSDSMSIDAGETRDDDTDIMEESEEPEYEAPADEEVVDEETAEELSKSENEEAEEKQMHDFRIWIYVAAGVLAAGLVAIVIIGRRTKS